MTDEVSSSNLNLFGDGSEEAEELLFILLSDDGDDDGGWIGGITNCGTGFKLKVKNRN